ncbi:amino acid adenylation domain-containing protein, partial [Pseudoalteromonas sp. MMG005]
ANQLACLLRQEGLQQGEAVGILLTRSVNMVVALLGVLKAGGTYIPLDPNYPRSRLDHIIEDTALRQVISQSNTHELLALTGITQWLLDDNQLQQQLSQYPTTNLARNVNANSAQNCYLIYTSGSTGKPKGVSIAHRNAMAMVQWGGEFYQQDELAGVLASTSLNFDLSVFELFVPLSFGGKVIVVENILSLLSEDIAGIRLVNTVPSGIDALVSAQRLPSSVVSVNLAGEPLKKVLVETLFAEHSLRRVVNLYGPSEDTTYSTYYEMTSAPSKEPRIGKPIANTQVYVLGAQEELLPLGVTGELYLGGAGVANGYFNQAELTASRFVKNPFSHEADSRLYKTGDLVRYDEEGQLCFIGRTDEQVKIRGFRVEVAEIEHHLNEHNSVLEAIVLVTQGSNEQQLQAYVRTDEEETGLAQQLRSHLLSALPEYMVPSRFVFMAQWPLSANGKIDKQA